MDFCGSLLEINFSATSVYFSGRRQTPRYHFNPYYNTSRMAQITKPYHEHFKRYSALFTIMRKA